MWNRLGFELLYRTGRPRWDTGITPPEVVRTVESIPPGRALDLGCGTGTNAIYLAQRGWEVVGVDMVSKAIAQARAKAARARVNVDFLQGDVTRLERVQGPFDFALDIGCFHALDAAGRQRYTRQLAQLVRPGGQFLLYAFDTPYRSGGLAISEASLRQLFSPAFELTRVEHGFMGERPTSYYWLTRV